MSAMDAEALWHWSEAEFQDWLERYPVQYHIDCIQELKSLAEEISALGSLQRAAKILTLAGKIADLLADQQGVGLVWRGWANVYQRHNRFEDSLKASHAAADVYRGLGDEREVAKTRTLEVYCLGALGHFQESAQLAAELQTAFHDFPTGRAFVAKNLAQVLTWAWRLEEALAEYQKAEQLFTGLNRPEHIARVKLDMGVLAGQLDDLAAAEQYFNDAYRMALAHQDTYTALKSRYNLASVYSRQEQFNQALGCIHQARDLLEQIEDPAEGGYVLVEEAHVRHGLGQREQATHLLAEAVERFDQPGFQLDQIIALAELAQLLAESGRPDDLMAGLQDLRRAAEILCTQPIPALQAQVALEQAEFLLRLQRAGEAIPFLEAARRIMQTLNLPLRLAWTRAALGDCLWQTGPAQAEREYQTALQLGAERIPQLAARCQRGLARLAFAGGKVEQSVAYYQAALDAVAQVRRQLASHAHQAGFAIGKEALVEELLGVLLALPGSPAQLFQWVERSKAWSLAELLSGAPSTPSDAEAGLQDLLAERERLQKSFDLQVNQLAGVAAPLSQPLYPHRAALEGFDARVSDELLRLRGQIQTIQEKIDLASQAALPWPEKPREDIDIHALLDGDSVYISYAEVDGKLIALSATHTPGDLQAHVLETSLSEVEHHLNFVRRDLGPGGARPAARLLQRLNWLYNHLLAPFENRLAGKTHLVISPVGCLSLLPFAALRLDEGEWLLERWTCSLVPNGMVWAALRRGASSSQYPLLVGYPGSPSDPSFLPGVWQELESLAKIFPGARQFYGEAATFEQVTAGLKECSLLHLAGHAWYDREHPLESGMPLAGGRWLRAADLYLRPNALPGSLVVLSGCETGLGRLGGGEVLGLNSAFLYAGAAGVLAGLWKVEDLATADLIEHFYLGLIESGMPAVALRRAQLALLGNPATAHPYFWAAFQLTGSDQISM